jgi:hypothetical protein
LEISFGFTFALSTLSLDLKPISHPLRSTLADACPAVVAALGLIFDQGSMQPISFSGIKLSRK